MWNLHTIKMLLRTFSNVKNIYGEVAEDHEAVYMITYYSCEMTYASA